MKPPFTEPVPLPDPIRTYREKGNTVHVYEPRFAEGYEGQLTARDLQNISIIIQGEKP